MDGKSPEMGAEGTGYPCWVTSGPNTFQSLCKSTTGRWKEVIWFSCPWGQNTVAIVETCRAVVLGSVPDRHMDMIKCAHECLEEAISLLKPGTPFAHVYDSYQKTLDKHGFRGQTLYGPAHSTGLQECEEPWIDNRSDRVVEPNMVLNVDIWIADDKYGVRLEDCVLITENGNEQLTTWQREPLILDI